MPLDRHALHDRFVRSRARTRALFDLIDEHVYYHRPISLRNPVVFYEGHLPAFAVNTLVKKALGRAGVEERLEQIFARGIDPESDEAAVARGNPSWPSRREVREYAAAAEALIADCILNAELERDDHPLLRGAEALWTILEHEEMHQETLAYMWHQLPYEFKRKPPTYLTAPPRLRDRTPARGLLTIPPGPATLGTPSDGTFGWDNERPAHTHRVAEFEIDAFNVTNDEFLQFMAAGGYEDPRWWGPADIEWVREHRLSHPPFWEQMDDEWQWRGMFERVPLPRSWPVYVTWAEASAYARWRGLRLPSEAQFHRAAFGTPGGEERPYPWGHDLRARPPANFDFARWDPEPVDAHADGASAFGVHDLVGNGWEWTRTVFGPFEGFQSHASYPEYSADFFDGEHYVLKGASPVTARGLVRPGFRNWFRPRYPFVYASFRCVADRS